ncbi:MAG TPA: family 20 glycosylhydrolase [Chthoniobacteraceae bacterium]|nr:family 20 glycosylhydrolase [Chthoniobacteraceae bacterium]
MTSTFSIDRSSAGALSAALEELAAGLPHRFVSGPGDHVIALHPAPGLNGFRLEAASGTAIALHYDRPCDAFRALGVLLGGAWTPAQGPREERSTFSSLGVMLDLSRNAVLRVDAVEALFRRFALMGINSVQLYMEDVYRIDGEPFFGYARGAYSAEELTRIDAYGAMFGIEVIPCIQALGHLEQMLQWPAYRDLIDVPGVLLVGEEKTYALIARMLDTVSACFRTRRIHIGMDEAHGVGQGNYRKRHGERRPFDILNEHLEQVTTLCTERGLRPMIWSDMYFRIGSSRNDYYDTESKIPPDVAAQIPGGVELVYWDYYHTDPGFYREWIDRHRTLGKEPVFAAGAWTWGRLWTHLPHAMATISAGMEAAREKKLAEAFVTIWGDDGAECDPFSILPAVQFFAESGYVDGEVSTEHLQQRFAGSCEGDFRRHLLASQVDYAPAVDPEAKGMANFGKWLLWHDPVLNFLEKDIPAALAAHYHRLARELETDRPSGPGAVHDEMVARLAQALSEKVKLHLEVKSACREGNVAQLQALSTQTLPAAIGATRELWRLHRKIWHDWFKPFGWEVIERRYATVVARLETLGTLLEAFIEDPKSHREILTFETEPVHPKGEEADSYFTYDRVSTSSVWK